VPFLTTILIKPGAIAVDDAEGVAVARRGVDES
jgi:hypothetical protein